MLGSVVQVHLSPPNAGQIKTPALAGVFICIGFYKLVVREQLLQHPQRIDNQPNCGNGDDEICDERHFAPPKRDID
jgi:hypothetical protein